MPELKRSALEQFVLMAPKPTLVGWNRLEPRPRKHAFDGALRGEVRDPLWTIARQWQFGEFRGEDAGSPVAARVELHTTWIDRYAARHQSAFVLDEPSSRPLETLVEREVPDIDEQMGVQLGRYWVRLLGTLGLSRDYVPAFQRQWPFARPRDDAPLSERQWHAAVAGRSMNGGAFHAHLEAGGDPLLGVATATTDDAAAIHGAALRFMAWFRRQYEVPTPREDAWAPSHLKYRFELSAPDVSPAAAGRETVLVCDDHCGGALDWYAFEIDPAHPGLRRPPGSGEVMHGQEVVEQTPEPLEFRGMPSPRFWQFESRGAEAAELDVHTSETAKLLLSEAMLVYGNDWFVLPVAVPVGTLATIAGLVVTDNFGGRVLVHPAERGSSMYTLSTRGRRWPDEHRLFIAPVAVGVQRGEALERVELIRDRVEDVVWAIESVAARDDGSAVAGGEIGPAGDGPLRYELLHGAVPEHWIPFLPVRVRGPNREVQLRRGAGRPRSELLRVGIDRGAPYYVHEDAVASGGTIVSRSWRRVRGYDGRVYTWLARCTRSGRTEELRGVGFDVVVA